jgi:hypothetical protein
MGANAQTEVPTFTANQILTAAQMNNSARTGVPVFATTTTRDAAFGGAGEKTLAEGQLAYIEATDVVQFYDGSNWVNVVSTSTTGTTLLKAKTTFTSVTSFSLANDTFTSTYDSYRINITFSTYASDSNITLRLRKTGTDNSANSYVYGFNEARQNGFGSQTGGTATSWPVAYLNSGAPGSVLTLEIRNPKQNVRTYGNNWNSASNFGDNSIYATQFGGFIHDVEDTYDALSILASTSVSGFYTVYGFNQ